MAILLDHIEERVAILGIMKRLFAGIYVGLFFVCFVIKSSASAKTSLISPPWKHCINRMHASSQRWTEFHSDNYPNGINKQTQCSWIITVNSNQKVLLSFFHLNLTGTMGSCFTQYMEIYEIDTGQLLQRFCGNRRPGDYVSYGKMLRVDLLADTVATPHQGFKMMVKATSKTTKSGYKKTFSFPAVKPKRPKKKRKQKRKPVKGAATGAGGGGGVGGGGVQEETTIPQPVRNGGKVDLKQMQKMRENIKRRVLNGTRIPSKNPQRPPPVLPPANQVPINPVQNVKQPEKITIVIEEDKEDKPEYNLYMIVGIAGGGLLILIIICILFKICVYDKRKSKKQKQAIETEKKSPLDVNAHPIQRRHDLPGHAVAPQPQSGHATRPDSGSSRRSNINSKQPFNRAKANTLDKINNDVITHNGMPGMLMPVEGGYMFYCPTESDVNTLGSHGQVISLNAKNATLTSPVDDEGYGTARTLQRTKSQKSERKKVPTLKRKLSEWEKQEIRKGTLHI